METTISKETTTSWTAFLDLIKNPVKFNAFLFKNLPAAFFSGVRLQSITEKTAVVSVPYKWFTRNPFRCTYFACLSMAAEMSTGILAMGNVYKRSPAISMLVTSIEGKFYQKATGTISFVCEQGDSIKNTIESSNKTGEAQSVRILTNGFNKQGELIAEFWITWSFKAKR